MSYFTLKKKKKLILKKNVIQRKIYQNLKKTIEKLLKNKNSHIEYIPYYLQLLYSITYSLDHVCYILICDAVKKFKLN